MKRSSRQIQFPGLRRGFQRCVAAMLFSAFALLTPGCNSKPNVETKSASTLSAIKVEVRDGGPVIITTSAAEFQALPSGYLQATLLKDGKRATLDDPEAGSATGSYLVHDGKDLELIPDFSQTKVTEATGKLGRGKRIEVSAKPLAPAGVEIQRTAVVEGYDDFPGVALVRLTFQSECSGCEGGNESFRHVVVPGIELRLGQGRCTEADANFCATESDGRSSERRLRWRDSGGRVLDRISRRSDRTCRNSALDAFDTRESGKGWSRQRRRDDS